MVAVVILATFYRQAGVPKRATIWAEDGTTFTQCAFDRPLLDCLATPYQGYLHTVPRIGASIAALGVADQLPFRLTLTAALVAALASALAALAVMDVTGSWVAGVAVGTSTALVYEAGIEVSGNLANLHWILLATSATILIGAWLGRRPGWADLILIGLTCLTSALGPALAAIAAIPVLQRRAGARETLAIIALCSVPQVLTEATAVRQSGLGVLTLDGVSAGATDLLMSGWFGPGLAWLNLVVPMLLVIVVGWQVRTIWVARSERARETSSAAAHEVGLDLAWGSAAPVEGASARVSRLKLELTATVALIVIGLAVWLVDVLVNRTVNPRYEYAPSVLLVVALMLAQALVARDSAGRVLAAQTGRRRIPRATIALLITAAVLATGFFASFRVVARASKGPNVLHELVAASARCAAPTDRVTIGVSPRGGRFTLAVPCSKIGPTEMGSPSPTPAPNTQPPG
ncbi:MAG TPA: hypothetical protein VIH37_07005 [Candidatus Limnocylindrales bacterium]